MSGLFDMLNGYLGQIVYWHWFCFAAVLLAIEVLGGVGFLLWIGISAVATGLVLWAFPNFLWPYQLLFFAIGSIATVVLWWQYLRRNPTHSDQPRLNRRNEQYIGRVFNLEQPIVNRRGVIRVDDSNWRIECDGDLPAGDKVIVTGVDGVILKVRRQD